MTASDKERLLAKFHGNPPAQTATIQQFQSESGVLLPHCYMEFLRDTNGGEGFVGNAYVMLWHLEELVEMNKAYQVAEYAPGLFLFGSDGGGEAFGFAMRSDAKPIVTVPFVGMDRKLARVVAPSFKVFLEQLLKS
jgi:hypothetical protein